VALENIARAMPELGVAEQRATIRRLYANLGQNLVDLLRYPSSSCSDILAQVEFHGEHHLQEALQRGRGAIYIGFHFGNWELFTAAIAALGYPVSAIVYPQHNRRLDERLNGLRRSQGIEVIYKREAAREVLRALRRNRLVGILIDQDAGRDGVFVDFMGRPASAARGPATFAVKTGAALVPGAAVRRGPRRHTGYIEAPVWPDPSRPRDEEIKRLTQEVTARLEKYVRVYPDHWLWTHRRWKTRPPADSVSNTRLPSHRT
jgi:KDO2-lipid IV(A) lauroyltransferase